MSKSKYANRTNPNDVGRRNADLERSRSKLMNSLIAFKKALEDTILLENKTQPEKQELAKMLDNINTFAQEVDTRNVGEGSRTLGAAAINGLLLLNDQINQLKFHNYYLTKRVEELEGQAETDDKLDEESGDSNES